MKMSKVYWDIAKQIARYEVDRSQSRRIQAGGKILREITETAFLSELYVARRGRELESELVAELQRSDEVVCVTGERGAGKTSVLRFARRELKKTCPNTRFVLWDLKRAFTQKIFHGMTIPNARNKFKTAFYRKMFSDLFQTPAAQRLFMAWVLAGPPDESCEFPVEVTEDLVDVSAPLLSELLGEDTLRRERVVRLKQYFDDNRRRYSAIFEDAKEYLRASQVVHAFLATTEFERVVVAIDNVDRLPARYQPMFMEEVNDGQLALGELATVAVAIRLENLKGLEARPGEGADHVCFVGPTEEQFPALLLPASDEAYTKEIFDKRQKFSLAVFRETVLDVLEERREEDDGVVVERLVYRVVRDEFLKSSVFNLANGSMRTVIGVYTGFISYLAKLDRENPEHFEELFKHEVWIPMHLHTLFFLWLRARGAARDLKIVDIHHGRSLNWRRIRPPYTKSANLRHLLMTVIKGYTVPGAEFWDEEDFPSFSRVFQELALLGFRIEEVRRAVRFLCAKAGHQARMIEFFKTEVHERRLSSGSSDHVRLTLAGEELVSNVYVKVGYIWAAAFSSASAKIGGKAESYFDLTRERRETIVLEYLIKRCEVHLRLMSFLQRSWGRRFGRKWVDEYRRRFGVAGRVQVERLLESAEGFFVPRDRSGVRASERNRFRRALIAYRALLRRLGRGTVFADLDLGRLVKE